MVKNVFLNNELSNMSCLADDEGIYRLQNGKGSNLQTLSRFTASIMQIKSHRFCHRVL
jgi:hypothetical protein